MTDNKELMDKILHRVKNSTWQEIAELGINAQQAQKIRNNKSVRFYRKSLERLRNKLI